MFDTCNLEKNEINRYGRQIILPSFGVQGQQLLKKSRVLIIGCGGLGCPSGVYLAAAGVGTIGLVDHDVVDESNLHRQICHKESEIGNNKVESLCRDLKKLNSSINIEPHNILIDRNNAIDIIKKYDVVLDCTDNVVTRYLINDCCVILGKPLVSASALGFEGQLTVYNYNNGPCYRCIFPVPPPANTVTNCSDGGVFGPVPGMLGTHQAMETIKILCQIGSTLSGKMFLLDAENANYRKIQLRPRNLNCVVCGDSPTVTTPIDYETFCNALPSDRCDQIKLLNPTDRISVSEYNSIIDKQEPHILIDVRPQVQIDICKFRNAIVVDMDKLQSSETVMTVASAVESIRKECATTDAVKVFVICRRGNNSQIAVEKLRQVLPSEEVSIKDIVGGMTAWARTFDDNLPVY